MEEIQIKLKPWGKEIWFAKTPFYAGKIIEIMKGHRCSLQFHEKKSETQYLYSGKIKLTYGTDKDHLEEKIIESGEKINTPANTIHRFEALEDSKIFEVSTPELDDIVKLHDDYRREGKGINDSLDIELHNQQI